MPSKYLIVMTGEGRFINQTLVWNNQAFKEIKKRHNSNIRKSTYDILISVWNNYLEDIDTSLWEHGNVLINLIDSKLGTSDRLTNEFGWSSQLCRAYAINQITDHIKIYDYNMILITRADLIYRIFSDFDAKLIGNIFDTCYGRTTVPLFKLIRHYTKKQWQCDDRLLVYTPEILEHMNKHLLEVTTNLMLELKHLSISAHVLVLKILEDVLDLHSSAEIIPMPLSLEYQHLHSLVRYPISDLEYSLSNFNYIKSFEGDLQYRYKN